jgi:hypothetical protein
LNHSAKKCLSLLGLLVFLVNSSFGSPAQAASIFLANGFIHDASGKPVEGIDLYITSTDPISAQTLTVWKTSDVNGRFQARSFAEYSIHYIAGRKCIHKFPTITGAVDSVNTDIDLELPAERIINFTVTTESGLPIADAQATVLERNFGNGFSCSSQPHARTDQDGKGAVWTFEGGTTTRPLSQAGIVYYMPFEDVQLSRFVSESDFDDNSVSIVLDDVPSVELVSPSTAKTTGFNIGATIFDSDGTVSAASIRNGIAGVESAPKRIQFKKVILMKRSFAKGKWSSWTQQAKASVGSNGKVKFTKIRLPKKQYQFRVLGVGFSIGSSVKTVKVK